MYGGKRIKFLFVTALFLATCMPAFANPDDDTGLKLGFDLVSGWQETGEGVNQDGNSVYTEAGMVWSLAPLLSVSWGFQGRRARFEPVLCFGSGSGMVDNGKVIGLADAQYDTFTGTSFGGGFQTRVRLADSLARFGLDFMYLSFSGDSEFSVDGMPAFDDTKDAEMRHMETSAVFDYDDPGFRPYFGLGIVYNHARFDDKGTDNYVTIESRNIFGAEVGVDIRRLFDSGFTFSVNAGYFSGPKFRLGLSYRF